MNLTHNATVSDEAVQVAIEAYSRQMDYNDDDDDALKAALTVAIPHLALSSAPCYVEVKKLEWSEHREPNKDCSYDHTFAETTIGKYQIEWKSWKDIDGHVIYLSDQFITCEYDLPSAKAAAQADFDRRILSQIVTKPVDVASFAHDLLSTWDQWMSCGRKDEAAKELSDKLILAACFAGVAHDDAMSAPLTADKAPADLLRTFLIALIDQNSAELDPYRAKNRPHNTILTDAGAKPVDVAAVRRQAFEEVACRFDAEAEEALIRSENCSDDMFDEFHDYGQQSKQAAAYVRALSSAEPAQGERT